MDACGRWTGDVENLATEARVHSCIQVDESDWNVEKSCDAAAWSDRQSNRPCTDDQVDFLDTQDQSQSSSATFEAVKLDGLDATDVDCDDVRQRLPAISRD